MGTRSAIGVKQSDGQLKMVCCYWDGYPSHNGMLLKRYYNSLEKAEELISYGEISSLADCIENCVFYRRDCGQEEAGEAKVYQSMEYVFSDMICTEFYYVFDNDKWVCYNFEEKEVDISEF